MGGPQAGVALSRGAEVQTDHLKAVFVQAYHITLLVCMLVAGIGVLTSLMRGPKSGPGETDDREEAQDTEHEM